MKYDTKLKLLFCAYAITCLFLILASASRGVAPEIWHGMWPVLIRYESLDFYVLCSLVALSYPLWTIIFYLWRSLGDPKKNLYPLSIPEKGSQLNDTDSFADFMAKLWFFSFPTAAILKNYVLEYFVTGPYS